MPRTFIIHLRRFAIAIACLAPSMAFAQPRPAVAAMMAPPLEGELNANEATADQWDLLPGIGPTTAARILEFVQKRRLTHASQLMRIKGIGRKTYDRIKPFLVLEGDTTLRVADPKALPDAGGG